MGTKRNFSRKNQDLLRVALCVPTLIATNATNLNWSLPRVSSISATIHLFVAVFFSFCLLQQLNIHRATTNSMFAANLRCIRYRRFVPVLLKQKEIVIEGICTRTHGLICNEFTMRDLFCPDCCSAAHFNYVKTKETFKKASENLPEFVIVVTWQELKSYSWKQQ